MSGNLGYIGGGIDLSYGQCARSQGWPRSPYHLLWFGCYRSPGRDGRMKNRFGRLHLGCLQWCLVEECGKLRVSCCRGVKPRQPSRVFTRRAALYGGHAQARQLIKSAAALRLTSAHQASRWTGGFAAVARALPGVSNMQCDSLDSATTDVLARARLASAPSVLTSGKTVQAAAHQNGDNVRGDGLSAHRRHFVLGARHLMWVSARAPLQCGHSSPRALLLRSRDVESSGQSTAPNKVTSRTSGRG